MASSGPNSPGTVATIDIGVSTWGSTSNATSSNNAYTTYVHADFGSLTESDQLKVTNFGFAIPGGSTIDGIVVEIERKVGSASFNSKDKTVKLVKGGTVSGDNKASASNWPTSDAYATYGGASDLWGLTLTDTDVNATDFGMVVSVQCDGTGKSSVTHSVDHIRITVYYTGGGGGGGGQPMMARTRGIPGMALGTARGW